MFSGIKFSGKLCAIVSEMCQFFAALDKLGDWYGWNISIQILKILKQLQLNIVTCNCEASSRNLTGKALDSKQSSKVSIL